MEWMERKRNLHSSIICVILVSMVISASGCRAMDEQSEYEKAYDIGLQAYTYGIPLLETNNTFLEMMSNSVTKSGGLPVNRFNHKRLLNDPNSKAVVAPGASALSSIAWLDLTEEPQVIHVPEAPSHAFVLALIDPYTENIRNLGSAQDTPSGDYVICGPGQNEIKVPSDTTQIRVAYTRIWIIGSTQVKGTEDLPNVNEIQDGYTITPLSEYGTGFEPSKLIPVDSSKKEYTIPTGLAFFDTLCQLMQQFPPPLEDKAQLKAFASVGIAPGRVPSLDSGLSADTIRGLTDAIAAGPGKIKTDIKEVYKKSGKLHNGYLLGGFGNYGTDYRLRAVIATIGLGAMSSEQAIFALTLTDDSLQPLNGSNQYVMHLAEAPPATEGWSITVYDTNGALIQNPIKRYQFNNLSSLTKNADGSVDIFFQAEEPVSTGTSCNWLPVEQEKGFQVIIRLLAPEQDKISSILAGSGWQPPALMMRNNVN